MSRKPFIGDIELLTGHGYVGIACRRLTGSLGKPSTHDGKYLVGADGKVAVFLDKESAQAAIDAAMQADGPWGPLHTWRSF
jgi:hypothetical protein